MNTSPASQSSAYAANNINMIEPSINEPTSHIGRYLIRTVIIALGLGLGGFLGLIIALFSGVIEISC